MKPPVVLERLCRLARVRGEDIPGVSRGGWAERGFTLAEVIIAVMIFGLVMAATYQIFWVTDTSWRRGEARIDAQQNLRIVMDRMSRELRQAKSFNIVEDPPDPPVLEFINQDGGEISYSLDEADNEIQRYVNGTGGNIVGYNIGAVEYQVAGSRTVTIKLTAVDSGYVLESTVTLRAPGS